MCLKIILNRILKEQMHKEAQIWYHIIKFGQKCAFSKAVFFKSGLKKQLIITLYLNSLSWENESLSYVH